MVSREGPGWSVGLAWVVSREGFVSTDPTICGCSVLCVRDVTGHFFFI